MVDVVTIKAGDKYGPEYVQKLKAGVDRFMETPHRFICLTDNTVGLEGVETMPLEHPELEGWWLKMTLFKPIKGLEEKIIWLDLDTVITGNIQFLTEYQGIFCMLKDFYLPETAYASGIMIFEPRKCMWIWETFKRDIGLYKTMGGDQQAIESIFRKFSNIPPVASLPDLIQDLWPGKVVSYKVHCQNELPKEAKIVCFHGRPRPSEVRDLPFMKEYWR